MNEDMTVRQSIEIDASAADVWEVLTNSDLTQRYMYGCRIVTDWNEGSDFNWVEATDGKLSVKGTLTKIHPKKLLQFTTFDPNAGDHYEDRPSNYSTVTYELVENNGHTRLAVSQGDFSKVVQGERRFKETSAGWESVLPKIKELAEEIKATEFATN